MRAIDADLFASNIKLWAENIRNIRGNDKCFFTEENILKAIDEQLLSDSLKFCPKCGARMDRGE